MKPSVAAPIQPASCAAPRRRPRDGARSPRPAQRAPTSPTPAACSRRPATPWERRSATRSPAWRRCPASGQQRAAAAAAQGSGRGTAPGNTGTRNRPRRRRRRCRAAPSAPPPPKPNEFQNFVEGATGRLLPIFGSTFFADAADTFQSLDNVPVSADYTIGPGDEIVIRAWGSIDVDYRSTVDRNGLLNLPKVGSFNVAGVKASDLEKTPARADRRASTPTSISQRLARPAARAARLRRRPGAAARRVSRCRASRRCCRRSSRPAARGRTARCARSLLRRDGKLISELDVYEFLVQGDKSKDVQLAAGDVIVFQPAGPRVALTGAIDTPAIYELKTPQEPLRDVLRYAGGAPVLANPNRVQLERIDPAQPTAPALRRGVRARRRRPAEGAARRRRADPARDLAAVRQRGDAEGPRRPAAALSVHARACGSAT